LEACCGCLLCGLICLCTRHVTMPSLYCEPLAGLLVLTLLHACCSIAPTHQLQPCKLVNTWLANSIPLLLPLTTCRPAAVHRLRVRLNRAAPAARAVQASKRCRPLRPARRVCPALRRGGCAAAGVWCFTGKWGLCKGSWLLRSQGMLGCAACPPAPSGQAQHAGCGSSRVTL